MSYFGSAVLLDEAARTDITCTLTRDRFYRRADRTLPQHFAGSESEDRHRAERVLKLGGAVVSVLDRSGREDVRLHQPRCHNTSAFGIRGYVDNTLPSCCYASP